MFRKNQVLHIAALITLISVFGILTSGSAVFAEASSRGKLIVGYDSYIDRFTILEDDTTEAIDELYFSIVNMLDLKNRQSRFELSNTFRMGNQAINENLLTGLTFGSKNSLLFELQNNLRFKYFRDGSDYEFGNDYLQSNFQLKIGRYLFDRLKLVSKSRIEFIDFRKRTSFDYDYRYFDTWIELEKGSYFDQFSRIGISAGYRDVPDTTALSFNRFQADLEMHFVSDENRKTEFAISADRRDYLENTRSSSWIIYSYFANSVTLSDRISYELRLESELYTYDDPSTTFFNTHFLRGAVGTSWPAGESVTFSVEPRFAGMLCRDFPEERYQEVSIIFGIETSGNEKYWISFSYEPGRRNYLLEKNDIYSDFYLNRLSFMGNIYLKGNMALNLFITHDPEFHSRRDDDFSLTMISATLSRSF
ncbi:MAG: hypothetical protein JW746_01245 [Candidatus Krumholzibacteriota bacterium]|nr:hypothetical protein [Candidatus Krumholzibacteriota bacterium]